MAGPNFGGLTTTRDPVTGEILLTHVGGNAVPGATTRSPVIPDELQAQAALPVVQDHTSANEKELSEEERLQKEQRQKENTALLAKQSAEQAQTKAAIADEEAGGPVGLVDAPMTDPLELINRGFAKQREVTSQESGVAVTKREIASENALQLANQQVEDDKLSALDRENNELRIQNDRAETKQNIDLMVKSKPTPPSPSALNLLGVFLGGLLAPSQGGRNFALESLQKNMDRETSRQLADFKSNLSAEQTKIGVINDESVQLERDTAAAAIIDLRKWEGIKNQLQAELDANKDIFSAEAVIAREKMLADIDIKQGTLVEKIDNSRRTLDIQKERNRISAMKKKKDKDTETKKSEPSRFGGAVYWDSADNDLLDFRTLSPKEKEKRRKLLSNIPMTDTETGESIRGIQANSITGAERMTKSYRDYTQVRLGTQRILKLLSMTDTNGKLRVLGGFAGPNGAKLAAEFTQLMVAMKDQWELGAIQAPDMKLLEGAMGQDPSTWASWVTNKANMNQVVAVVSNLQARGEIQMRAVINAESSTPSSFRIETPKFNPTSDLDAEENPQPAETAEQVKGNVSSNIETGKDLTKQLSVFSAMAKTALLPSKARPSGGEIATGKDTSEMRHLRQRPDISPKQKAQLTGTLVDLYRGGVFQTGTMPWGKKKTRSKVNAIIGAQRAVRKRLNNSSGQSGQSTKLTDNDKAIVRKAMIREFGAEYDRQDARNTQHEIDAQEVRDPLTPETSRGALRKGTGQPPLK